MAEYAGYVAPKTVDYGAISSGLLSNKISIEQLKQSQELAKSKLLQKELQRQEDIQRKGEAEFKKDLTSLKIPEATPDKPFNEYIFNGAEKTRSKLTELYEKKQKGQITVTEYNKAYSNFLSQWDQTASTIKSYNSNLQKLTNEIGEGKQSPIGVFKIGKFANAGQYGNKELVPKDDGRIEQVTYNKDGKPLVTETITNIQALGATDLYSDYSVDYDKIFKQAEDALGEYKKEVGTITTSDKTKNPDFAKNINLVIKGVLNNDDAVVRLLTTKAGYAIYSNDDELQANIDQGIPAEKNIRYIINSKGAWSPDLSVATKVSANKFLYDNIKARLGYAKTVDEPRIGRSSTPKKPTEAVKKRTGTYKTSQDAYKSIISLGDKSPYRRRIEKIYRSSYPEFGVTSRILYFDPKTKKNIAGLAIYSLGEDGKPEREVDRLLTAEDYFGVYTPRDKKGEEDVEYKMAAEEEEGSLNFDE
jgi:hypothetical protein